MIHIHVDMSIGIRAARIHDLACGSTALLTIRLGRALSIETIQNKKVFLRQGRGRGGTPIWTWLGYPPIGPGRNTPEVPPPPAGPGWGTPPGVDRQTPVKTVPYRRTTYAVGNNIGEFCFLIFVRNFPRHHCLDSWDQLTTEKNICCVSDIDQMCFTPTGVCLLDTRVRKYETV